MVPAASSVVAAFDNRSTGARVRSHGETEKDAPDSPGALTVMVRTPAVPTMPNAENVATPFTAAALAPVNVPLPAVSVAVTVPLPFAAKLPAASRSSMIGCVLNVLFRPPPLGAVRTARAAAAPGCSVKTALVTDASPGAEKRMVRFPTRPSSRKAVKVAAPCAATAVVGPPRVPPPSAMEALTVVVAVVTGLSAASRTSMMGCVLKGAPDAAPPGCTRMPSRAGAPAVSVKAVLVTGVRPAAVNTSVRAPMGRSR